MPDARSNTQLTLMPAGPLTLYTALLPIDLLAPTDELLSPPPSRSLVESIRRYGVMEPVLVSWREHGVYDVVDGRRRVKAARELGIDSIPVTTVKGSDGLNNAALSMHVHATRSANPISDLNAIGDLSRALTLEGRLNAAEIVSEIAKATGLAVSTVKARLALLRLPEAIRHAVSEGTVSIAVAESIAKLDRSYQEQLVAVLAEKGTIRPADVKEVRKVEATQVASEFDWDAIDAAGAPLPYSDLIGSQLLERHGEVHVTVTERVDGDTFKVRLDTGDTVLVRVVLE